ncbi:MAG: acyl-CoA dehydrogenase, partial [Polyangiaceae bacterium]
IKELSPDDTVPPLAHWLYFNTWARESQLGPDGHPRRGGFMPPITLPRRMFAGGRIKFVAPLALGESAERVSTITLIKPKTGASGELIFVTVKHEIFGKRGLAIEEEQDIVYRDASKSASPETPPPAKPSSPPEGSVLKRIQPDPVMLFRYSALTSNGHRIHYDYEYVTHVEGYPGLIVHGPLQAQLLADLVREFFKAPIASFSFQARRPIFNPAPFDCIGRRTGSTVELVTADLGGNVCMKATAELAS